MLAKLTVKNFALVSSLELEFGERLNILSGETGAGKSIIVDSITMLVGGRYDKTMLRFGESSGYVEGVFTVTDRVRKAVSDYLDDGDDEIIVLRKFNSDGKNEIRINGRSATLGMLKSIGAALVDICGQNEHQSLANVGNHIKVVDFYARREIDELKSRVAAKYAELKDVQRQCDDIGDAKSRARNLDVYKFQLEEIKKAALKDGEEEELTAKRKRFLGAERIATALSEVMAALSESENGLSATELVSDAKNELASVASYDDRYSEWNDRLHSVEVELEDIADSVSEELDSLDFSQSDLDKIEKRLDVIRNVTRKYGDYAAVVEFKKELEKRIDETENADGYYEKLSKRKAELLKELYADCSQLSAARKKAAVELQRSVENELSELGMENSSFVVVFDDLPKIEDCESRLSANGMDSIEFYLSPNEGQPLKPLVKIISGGELSRLMLALKVVSSGIDETPTVIFDEIDTGISGKVGQEIAKKLARLSRDRQLLCVTHLPQIASMADNHYFIDKYAADGKTYTRVAALDKNAQIDEIARLSGGKDISSGAIENAGQMKKWSDEYKNSL